MSSTYMHTHLGSPLPPPSRSKSFAQLSPYHHLPAAEVAQQTRQYHQQKQIQNPAAYPEPGIPPEEANISPLSTPRPDSPTLGNLSPISLISPSSPFPPTPFHANHTQKTPNIPHMATLHLKDHLPFKPASTRFPAYTAHTHNQLSAYPAAALQEDSYIGEEEEEKEEGEEALPTRPQTLYLADHHPHRTAPIARPHYINGLSYHEGRSSNAVAQRAWGEGEDVEMQDVQLRSPRSRVEGDYGNGGFRAQMVRGGRDGEGNGSGFGRIKTKYEMKRRRTNCLIGWSFLVALVGLGAFLGVLVMRANES